MHVVVVAVVGETYGDEGFQLRRAAGCDLQAVEAAPGFTEHTQLAVTPRLSSDPGHHFQAVVVFLFEVFIIKDTVGFAGPAQVYPDAGITVSGQVGVANSVTNGGSIVLAIGNVFEQGGEGLRLRVQREPDPGGEPGAIRQRNPGMFNFPDVVREVGFDALHGRLPFDLLLRVINSS